MINAARLQVEHLGREKVRSIQRPRRADDNLSEFFPAVRNPASGRIGENSIFAVRIRANSNSPMGGKFLIGMLSTLSFVSRDDDD